MKEFNLRKSIGFFLIGAIAGALLGYLSLQLCYTEQAEFVSISVCGPDGGSATLRESMLREHPWKMHEQRYFLGEYIGQTWQYFDGREVVEGETGRRIVWPWIITASAIFGFVFVISPMIFHPQAKSRLLEPIMFS
jgi:hypothetical protein